jgi:hypothetical protein
MSNVYAVRVHRDTDDWHFVAFDLADIDDGEEVSFDQCGNCGHAEYVVVKRAGHAYGVECQECGTVHPVVLKNEDDVIF